MLKILTDPVASEKRIQAIDIIRGFALFGVIVVNFGAAGSPPYFDIVNQSISWFVSFFMSHKFMSMFSFLFGLGFALQTLKSSKRDFTFMALYFRRLLFLYIIGVANFILTDGDILQEYAMAGILLLLFYKLPLNWLPVIALVYLLISPTIIISKDLVNNSTIKISATKFKVDVAVLNNYAGVYKLSQGSVHIFKRSGDTLLGFGPKTDYVLIPDSDSGFRRLNPNNTYTSYRFRNNTAGAPVSLYSELPNGEVITGVKISDNIDSALSKRNGARSTAGSKMPASYQELIQQNAKSYKQEWSNWSLGKFLLNIDNTVALFLLGLYAGRRRIFQNINKNRSFFKKGFAWFFFIGIIFTAINPTNFIVEYFQFSLRSASALGGFIWYVGFMALGIAYIALLALFLQREKIKRLLSWLAPVGRMGLTNYLLQSFAVTFIFNKFGLHVPVVPVISLSLAILFYLILIGWSRWWFGLFSIGPVEWLWRSATYLKFQPITKKDTPVRKP